MHSWQLWRLSLGQVIGKMRIDLDRSNPYLPYVAQQKSYQNGAPGL